MTENGIGDFFITDADETAEIGGVRVPPVIVPSVGGAAASRYEPESAALPTAEPESIAAPSAEPAPGEAPAAQPEGMAAVPSVEPIPATEPADEDQPVPAAAPSRPFELVEAAVGEPPAEEPDLELESDRVAPHKTREQQLIGALDTLMAASDDIEATALVSLDGFIMAAALPEGMLEDKVGAMSAAILGLGERAAIELGRGNLTQVFIEGEGGYVLLIAVGDRAVLTVLASEHARLGLVLYDMRAAAEAIARLLG